MEILDWTTHTTPLSSLIWLQVLNDLLPFIRPRLKCSMTISLTSSSIVSQMFVILKVFFFDNHGFQPFDWLMHGFQTHRHTCSNWVKISLFRRLGVATLWLLASSKNWTWDLSHLRVIVRSSFASGSPVSGYS
jgi:hypothetical protein